MKKKVRHNFVELELNFFCYIWLGSHKKIVISAMMLRALLVADDDGQKI